MAIDVTLNIQTAPDGERTNTTITKPTGTVNGDFLLAVFRRDLVVPFTPPAGWTIIDTLTDPGVDTTISYKWAGGSEPAAYTWTHGLNWTEGLIKRYTGVAASGDPLDATSSKDNGTGVTATSSSITTSTNGAALVQIIQGEEDWSGETSPIVEKYDGTSVWLGDGLQAAAGSSGNKSVTASGSLNWYIILLALKPFLAAVSGTATESITESDIVTGGKNIIITLTGDTWVPE